MPSHAGKIVLMGSGELTATMVEVHKGLLAGLGNSPQAVFLDTPAGFQLNVDLLSQKAVDYFGSRVRHTLGVVSFKSSDAVSAFDAERSFLRLKQADYILIGPGSPTYAVRQWRQTPIPDILVQRVKAGACLVAASAAALTTGRATLPVYEIYKVGQAPYWEDGMDVLKPFGLDLVVVPHWNNAEGGTHDTRFCYMGEPRFRALESMLPRDVAVLGLDEHTACILDFEKQAMTITGLGRVTLRRGARETVFEKGECLPLAMLDTATADAARPPSSMPVSGAPQEEAPQEDSFWETVHTLEEAFQQGLQQHTPEAAAGALLELDGAIWKAQQDLESPEFISQAREIFRDMIVLLGTQPDAGPRNTRECLAPLVDQLLKTRESFRQQKKWPEADAVRQCLEQAHIAIEDTREGTRWKLEN